MPGSPDDDGPRSLSVIMECPILGFLSFLGRSPVRFRYEETDSKVRFDVTKELITEQSLVTYLFVGFPDDGDNSSNHLLRLVARTAFL